MVQGERPSAEEAREILRGVLRDMPDYVAELTDEEAIERALAVLRARFCGPRRERLRPSDD